MHPASRITREGQTISKHYSLCLQAAPRAAGEPPLERACRDPSLWPELRVLNASFRTEARWMSFLLWLAVRASGLRTLVFSKKGVLVRHF